MIKLLILYFCNLVLDYPLQDEFLKKYKSKNNYVLFVHCAIWAFGISIVLIPLNLFAWWKVIMLLVGHFIIDYWKCHRLYLKKEHRSSDIGKSDYNALYLDQFLHFVQILLCLI